MTQPPVPARSEQVPAQEHHEQAVPEGVAQALSRLDQLDGRPVSDHVEVFDDVHRLLQDSLATLDEV